MDELIKKLQEKAKACGDKTKEDRARKGAYIDCIVELKALRKHAVIGSKKNKKNGKSREVQNESEKHKFRTQIFNEEQI